MPVIFTGRLGRRSGRWRVVRTWLRWQRRFTRSSCRFTCSRSRNFGLEGVGVSMVAGGDPQDGSARGARRFAIDMPMTGLRDNSGYRVTGGLPPLPCWSQAVTGGVYHGRDIPCARMSSSLLLICHVGGRGGGVWVQPRQPADGLARSLVGKGRTRAGSLRPAAAPHGTVAARWPAATLDRPAPTTSLAGCRSRPCGRASRSRWSPIGCHAACC